MGIQTLNPSSAVNCLNSITKNITKPTLIISMPLSISSNVFLSFNSEAKSNFDYNKMAGLTQTIKFNLGGHINHSIYWENLAPIGRGGGEYPGEQSALTQAVVKQFGSYENLQEELTKKTVPIQGSGWGWLAWDNISKSLRIIDTPNQEMLAPQGLTPLLSKF
jgi:Fe-Mn family superoxide dismutase